MKAAVGSCIILTLSDEQEREEEVLGVRPSPLSFPGDCSEEQLKSLEEFREIAAVHNGGKLDPRWDEVYLLRFLRARKFNLKETEKMWKDYIAWRVANGVDKLHVSPAPLRSTTSPSSCSCARCTRTATTSTTRR